MFLAVARFRLWVSRAVAPTAHGRNYGRPLLHSRIKAAPGPPEEREKELRGKRPPDTKAQDVIPVIGGEPGADGRAEVPMSIAPSATASHAKTWVTTLSPCRCPRARRTWHSSTRCRGGRDAPHPPSARDQRSRPRLGEKAPRPCPARRLGADHGPPWRIRASSCSRKERHSGPACAGARHVSAVNSELSRRIGACDAHHSGVATHTLLFPV
jgi:hypothetical protein